MESERLAGRENQNAGNKVKKMTRKELLKKKKAIDEIIKSAYASDIDHLTSFAPFRHYRRNGLSVYLESGRGDKLSSHLKQYIQKLLKFNMEAPYGAEWPTEEKVKRREMVAPEALYIFVHDSTSADSNHMSKLVECDGVSTQSAAGMDTIVGFVQYRFTVEEEIPVLYVYELQLEPRFQGKGLGKFLMQLLELIARKNRMGAVMLTVQKQNTLAMSFYINKLRYSISTMSPSRVDLLIGLEKNYEILCKAFDHESKAILESEGDRSTITWEVEDMVTEEEDVTATGNEESMADALAKRGQGYELAGLWALWSVEPLRLLT